MNQSYSMVLVSLFSALILLTCTLIYRFIYPKKKINLFFCLLLISLLPIISIFRPGVYESGDFSSNTTRAIEFYQLLKDGQWMPSWAGNLNATYGYPAFIFLNPLPYYNISLFHFLGLSFITSMKTLLALSFMLSGVFFYLWAKKEIKNTFVAFAGAIVYLFTPYHLVDLHFRADVGEVMVFALLPLYFYSLISFRDKKNVSWFLIPPIIFALMMFSHQTVTVLSLFIILPYIFYLIFASKKKVKDLLLYIGIFLLGCLFSLYVWYPHLSYAKYTLSYLQSEKIVTFLSVQDILYSPWRFGFLFQGHKGELSHLIGYSQIVIIFAVIFLLLFKNKILTSLKNKFYLWLGLSFFLIIMLTPLSRIVWQVFTFLNFAQFSYRFLLTLSFALAALAVYLFLSIKKFPLLIWVFLCITIGYTLLNWGNRGTIPTITDATLTKALPERTTIDEGFCCIGQPKWIAPDVRFMNIIPSKHIKIVQGTGEIQQTQRTSIIHEYITSAIQPMNVQENTWYFPGWHLFIDNKPAKLGVTTGRDAGIILFSIPSGLHKIDLIYHDLPDLVVVKMLSFISFFVSLLLVFILFLRKKTT